MPEETTPIERLRVLLTELLQLDLSDLDFGIYRLLRIKRDEVRAFLDEQLPAAVDEAFAAVTEAQRDEAEAAVVGLSERIRKDVAEDALNADGSVADQYRDIAARAIRDLIEEYEAARRRIEEIRTSEAQKTEVFNHLYDFFRRYYEDGDFIPKRRFTQQGHERYAIPYNGEETLLHWANRGQHYVKNAEVFRDYAFRVEGDLLADPCRVRFVLSSASVSPGDTKGDIRYFFPLADGVVWDATNRTLRFPFHYRRPTAAEAEGLGRTGVQETILESTLSGLRTAIPEGDLRAALLPSDTTENQAEGVHDAPPLLKHLRLFVRRNTADYFVHRDLAGFLERELEFYVKDQILHIADLDGDLKARQRMLRVLRSVAGTIITFLAQLEEVQKRLFEKRKFVLSTDYLVLISAVPRDMWSEVTENEVQVEEWRRLFHVDPEESLFNPTGELNEAFLEQHPTLVVSTSLFDDDFRHRVLASFDDLEEATGGILVHSENYQALRLLEPRFRGQIKCIYIDPPYNTGSDDFLYKDRYQHSSWLTMMEERLRLGRNLLRSDGVMFASVDGREAHRLTELLDQVYSGNKLAEIIWHNARDNNPTRIAVEHEYVLAYAKNPSDLATEWKSTHSYAKELLLDTYAQLKERSIGFDEMVREFRKFIRDNAATIGKLQRYKHIDDEGPYTGSESVHNPHPGGYEYELIHPKTGKPMNKPANGYRFPEDTMRRDYLEKDRLIFGPDEKRIVKIKLYLEEYQEAFRSVIRLDSRLGAYALRDLFGTEERVFKNPKAVELIQQFVSFSTDAGDYVLDFVAGSGTTAEAAIRLGDSARARRRFLLVEMGAHFDRIVVPRVKKLCYTTDWKKGAPAYAKVEPEATRHPLIKILRLESYEDSLHNLVSAETLEREDSRQVAFRSAVGDDEYRIRYLAKLPLEASATMLSVDKLAHPFRYELEVLTDDGPETRTVDLVETFNLVYGLRVRRVTRWVNEDDGEEGRTYTVITGEDPESQSTLVLWRDMEDLDPAVERTFLETQIEATVGSPYDVMLINGDSTVPGVRSLDPIFKARISEGETG